MHVWRVSRAKGKLHPSHLLVGQVLDIKAVDVEEAVANKQVPIPCCRAGRDNVPDGSTLAIVV